MSGSTCLITCNQLIQGKYGNLAQKTELSYEESRLIATAIRGDCPENFDEVLLDALFSSCGSPESFEEKKVEAWLKGSVQKCKTFFPIDTAGLQEKFIEKAKKTLKSLLVQNGEEIDSCSVDDYQEIFDSVQPEEHEPGKDSPRPNTTLRFIKAVEFISQILNIDDRPYGNNISSGSLKENLESFMQRDEIAEKRGCDYCLNIQTILQENIEDVDILSALRKLADSIVEQKQGPSVLPDNILDVLPATPPRLPGDGNGGSPLRLSFLSPCQSMISKPQLRSVIKVFLEDKELTIKTEELDTLLAICAVIAKHQGRRANFLASCEDHLKKNKNDPIKVKLLDNFEAIFPPFYDQFLDAGDQ